MDRVEILEKIEEEDYTHSICETVGTGSTSEFANDGIKFVKKPRNSVLLRFSNSQVEKDSREICPGSGHNDLCEQQVCPDDKESSIDTADVYKFSSSSDMGTCQLSSAGDIELCKLSSVSDVLVSVDSNNSNTDVCAEQTGAGDHKDMCIQEPEGGHSEICKESGAGDSEICKDESNTNNDWDDKTVTVMRWLEKDEVTANSDCLKEQSTTEDENECDCCSYVTDDYQCVEKSSLLRFESRLIEQHIASHLVLSDRIKGLQKILNDLKKTLQDEKDLSHKEKEEYNELLQESISKEPLQLVEFLGEPEHPMELDAPKLYVPIPYPTSTEVALVDYESRLAQYQDALTHVDKRACTYMRRQLAVNTYKMKLMEVEKLCNDELSRVMESKASLEPLNKIASEWNSNVDSEPFPALRTPPLHLSQSSYASLSPTASATKLSANISLAQDSRELSFQMNVAQECASTPIWTTSDTFCGPKARYPSTYSSHL